MLEINICIALQLVLLASAYGWGRVFIHLLLPARRPTSLIDASMLAWIGWALSLLILQILHLLIPISGVVSIVLHGLGIVSTIVFIRRDWPSIDWRRTATYAFATFGLSYPFSAWLAARSFLAPTIYDNGLYHFSIIRWINEYSIVPGLVNLHGRLAFNQSYFVYVSALNFYPYFGHGRSLANTSLIILSALTIVAFIVTHFRDRDQPVGTRVLRLVPSLFATPIILYWGSKDPGIWSTSADLAVAIVQVPIFLYVAHAIGQWIAGTRRLDLEAIAVGLLAVTLVTMKVSTVILAAGVYGYILAYFLKQPDRSLRQALRLFLPAVVIAVVWTGRGYIMSGLPVYPSSIGRIPVEWAVSPELADHQRHAVTSFARDFRAENSSANIGNWDWFDWWWDNFQGLKIEATWPLRIAGVLSCIALISGISFGALKRYWLVWLFFVPIIGNIVFWFFMAPDIRFAGSLFFLLPAMAGLVLLLSLHDRLDWRRFRWVIAAVLIIGNLQFVQHVVDYRGVIFTVSLSGWGPARRMDQAPMETKTTDSGLTLYVPIEGDQCWDAPLPCTPYFRPNLRLRREGDIGSGFVLDPEE